MEREVKRIVNVLRCPLCNAQIDGGDLSVLYCAKNREHYSLSMYENPTIIESEIIKFYDSDYLTFYKITRRYTEEGKLSSCMICMEKPGVTHSKNISIDFDPLNIHHFSIEKVIKRIKNIFIFQ
jgi:hypothetical protein